MSTKNDTILISSPKDEGVLQASKWLKHRALLSGAELDALIAALPPFRIFNVASLVPLEEAEIPLSQFRTAYHEYASSIAVGKTPSVDREIFSTVWTTSLDALYAFEAKQDLYMVKPRLPVVQLSHHRFQFSEETGEFYSMVHSDDAISWGLQFSYPQIFSNSIRAEVCEVLKEVSMPNNVLFQSIAKWMRNHTRPTPFLHREKALNATFRTGRDFLEEAAHYSPMEVRR